ncbi:hypothetical protein [Kribbella sp. NBC_00889]|uniref:hypothetical protein n=1 Tax=Kribbella sp. NBC_00889 TaxID=2975974 RepID=UPI00386AB631|nr:hypothetical protein OG817_32570 [Kribbella sp. NBC_00889]
MRSVRLGSVAVVVAAVVGAGVVAGCGDEAAGGSPGIPSGSPVPGGNDSAVTAAADLLNPLLLQDFAASFAGLVLDHDKRVVIVYRKPDAALDARVREKAKGVTVELRDARMSQREMADLRDRVIGDIGYWGERGVSVNGAGPKPDGSGVEVMTTSGNSSDQKKLRVHYRTDAILVTQGQPVIVAPMTVPATPLKRPITPITPPPR